MVSKLLLIPSLWHAGKRYITVLGRHHQLTILWQYILHEFAAWFVLCNESGLATPVSITVNQISITFMKNKKWVRSLLIPIHVVGYESKCCVDTCRMHWRMNQINESMCHNKIQTLERTYQTSSVFQYLVPWPNIANRVCIKDRGSSTEILGEKQPRK